MKKYMNKDKLAYRQCVGIALFNKQGQVFVGERVDTPNAWQMPQGGMDNGETVKQTAIRELAEEVGTDKAKIIKVSNRKVSYDFPDNLAKSFWNGKYRGQEQTWVAARFTGANSDINLNSFDPPEFCAWQWVDLSKTLDLIVPFKRDIYREVIDMFEDIGPE